MSRHDDLIRLRHMRDHAAEAIAMIRHKSVLIWSGIACWSWRLSV